MDKCMDKGRNYLLLEHQENNQKVFTDLSELKSHLFLRTSQLKQCLKSSSSDVFIIVRLHSFLIGFFFEEAGGKNLCVLRERSEN